MGKYDQAMITPIIRRS